MAAPDKPAPQAQSYTVQASPATFDHAAWLSAVHSEVITVHEDEHRLSIFPMTDLLRWQFDKLGAVVSATA